MAHNAPMRVELRTGGVTLFFHPARLSLGEVARMVGIGEVWRDMEGRVHSLEDGKYFSYARTKNLTVAAVSAVPVGVDAELQVVRPRDLDMARRFFTSDEVAFLEARTSEKRLHKAFWGMFTAKEALAKLLGTGLWSVLDTHAFVPAPLQWWQVHDTPVGPVSVRHIYFNDVTVAVAVARVVDGADTT